MYVEEWVAKFTGDTEDKTTEGSATVAAVNDDAICLCLRCW